MTLDDLRASAPPEILAYLESTKDAFHDLEARDDHQGVQARMMAAMTEAFILCLAHERARAMARGTSPEAILSGGAAVIGNLIFNLINNMFEPDDRLAMLGPVCERVIRAAGDAITGRNRVRVLSHDIHLRGASA